LLIIVQGQELVLLPLAGQRRRKEQDIRIMGICLEIIRQKLQGFLPLVRLVQALGQPLERRRGFGVPPPDLAKDLKSR
jgi:hypothetical protein